MQKVSVIIPTYNERQYLCEAVDSVLAQTYKDFELLVIDDGSTDDTKEALSRYKDKIRYIFQKNQGTSVARNTGIREARGEYLAFLDDDDLWFPDKIKLQVEIMDANPEVAVIFTDSEVINEKGELLRASTRSPDPSVLDKNSLQYKMAILNFNDSSQFKGDMYREMLLRDPVRLSSALVKKKCLKDIDYFDEFLSVCEDYDFFLRISRKYHLLYLNKVTTRYRITESSISGKLGLREYRYREHDAKMLETHLHDASPEYVPLIRKRIWESYRIAAWGYLQLNDLKKVRELCFCSLRYKMIQPKVYVYFLISFLPISSINILKRIKHLLCQK